ncbi:MAG: serine hydrolase [Austwickia sp.]|nr:serine hydrolase [Austwickia sp.]MBK9102502.1 serine hydrolase [Austwickia sp.]
MTTTSSTTSPAAATPVAVPDTPVGRQVRWVVAQLEAPDEKTPVSDHFTPGFLKEVNEVALLSLFMQVRGSGPYVVTAYRGDQTRATATLTSASGGGLTVLAGVDPSGKLDSLFLRPRTSVPPLADWAAFDRATAELGADVAVLAADVVDGRCVPRHAVQAAQSMPMGSAFKLYVLGAVAEAVRARRLRWDQQLTVTDAVRSLPSGELQNAANGTKVTVEKAATGMISVSDNTATDLLMAAVGRPAVESAMTAMGHHDPAQNRPFLTTREFFELAWGTPNRRAAWVKATPEGRRTLLGGLSRGRLPVPAAAVTTPAWPDRLEWFGSPNDLCAAHVALQRLAADPATRATVGAQVRAALSDNPGVTLPETVTYAAFKGGNSPGAMSLSWYVESPAGPRVLVLMIRARDPGRTSDATRIAGLGERALELLVR